MAVTIKQNSCNYTFAQDGSKGTLGFILSEEASGFIDNTELQTQITAIIGTTSVDVSSDGRLKRTPPYADSIFPFLFADKINNLQPVPNAVPNQVDANQELEVPTFGLQTQFKKWQCSVDFLPRPYPVATDDFISTLEGSWYIDSGAQETFTYATEWERYVDWQFFPSDDVISQAKGTMTFNSSYVNVNGKQYAAMPRLPLPDGILKLYWVGVPLRYVTSANSYITRWRGRINQKAWTGPAGPMGAGSLLYLAYTPRKYTPPIQATDELFPGIFSTEKLCNIEMTFLYTSRTLATGETPNTPPNNGHYVVGGHNLLPHNDKLFHYAVVAPVAVNSVPTWLSFPIELMFTDPDCPVGSI